MAQAVFGLPGVSLGQYGSIALDVRRFEPDAAFNVNLDSDAFGGLRAFLDLAVERGHTGPGEVAVRRSGHVRGSVSCVPERRSTSPSAPPSTPCAPTCWRSRWRSPSRLPSSPQLVLIDEPWIGSLMDDDFAIAPETAVDLISEAMAVAERVATVGVHCCADADLASLLATGPKVLSIPTSRGRARRRRVRDVVPRGRRHRRLGCRRDRGSDPHVRRALLARSLRPVVWPRRARL